jgi:quinol monooxygenase YgiN
MTQQLILIARLTAKPGQSETLGHGLMQLIAPTSEEAGSLGYVLHRDNEDPDVWILYETWASRSDLDAHFEKPYTKAMLARFPELLAKGMELTFCTVVAPHH